MAYPKLTHHGDPASANLIKNDDQLLQGQGQPEGQVSQGQGVPQVYYPQVNMNVVKGDQSLQSVWSFYLLFVQSQQQNKNYCEKITLVLVGLDKKS